MTAIWRNDGTSWQLLAPSGFPDEAALHTLVEEEPQILPLAGSPHLVIVGREVRLGSGIADLVAIEPSGRLAIIEVKLAGNAEARRAVIAQALAYAASLYGSTVDDLEVALGPHLAQRRFASLGDAVEQNDQEGSFAESDFRSNLSQNLIEGRFRLVFVLDSAPSELVTLASFLEAISDKLLIDLVAVSSFEVDRSQIVVPQRITPESRQAHPEAKRASERSSSSTGSFTQGSAEFRRSIEEAPEEARAVFTRLTDWAESLETKGLATLGTYTMKNGLSFSLLPYVRIENAGLITIYNWRGKPYLQFWRSVFERRAPNSIAAVERCIAPTLIGQGNQISGSNVTDELLEALTTGYEEAAHGGKRASVAQSDGDAEQTTFYSSVSPAKGSQP